MVGPMTSPRSTEHPMTGLTPALASYDSERTDVLQDRPIPPAGPNAPAGPQQPWTPHPAGPPPAPPWTHSPTPAAPQGSAPGWPTTSPEASGHPPRNPIPHTPAARPGRRKPLILAAIAAAVVLIVIAVAVPTITKKGTSTATGPATTAAESSSPAPTNPPSPQPQPTVPMTALSELLLSEDQVAAATGWPAMPVTEADNIRQNLNSYSGGDKCQSQLYVASARAYQGSGYTSVRRQWIGGGTAPDVQDWIFIDGVAAFQDAADATKMVDKAKQSWQQCANQTAKDRQPSENGGYDVYWAIGDLTVDDGVLFIPKIQEGGDGWTCWRALGARNNVTIDVNTCGTGATKANAQGAYNAIAANVDVAA